MDETILKKWLERADEGLDLAVREAPQIVRELYNYDMAINIVNLVIGVVLIAVGLFCVRWLCKVRNPLNYHESTLMGVISGAILGTCVGLPVVGVAAVNLIYMVTAPRAYMLERVMNLLS